MCENGDVWTLITISLPILIGKACFFLIEKHVDIKWKIIFFIEK